MDNQNSFKKKSLTLRKALFWDIDIRSIDFEKHKRFVISRILMRGSLQDFLDLLSFYGEKTLKEEIVKIRYLDKKTLRFCSFYFHIPQEEFRCYKQRQLHEPPTPF